MDLHYSTLAAPRSTLGALWHSAGQKPCVWFFGPVLVLAPILLVVLFLIH
jgi:hypothetical protein